LLPLSVNCKSQVFIPDVFANAETVVRCSSDWALNVVLM